MLGDSHLLHLQLPFRLASIFQSHCQGQTDINLESSLIVLQWRMTGLDLLSKWEQGLGLLWKKELKKITLRNRSHWYLKIHWLFIIITGKQYAGQCYFFYIAR